MDDRFYSDLLDWVSDGVCFVDRQRRITYWSRGAEEITGYAAADVVGRACSDGLLRHVTAEGAQLCVSGCPLAAVMEDGIARTADVYLHHKAGHRLPVVVQGSPRRDASGRIIGCGEVFSLRGANDYAGLDRPVRDYALDPVTTLPTRRFGELHLCALAAAVRDAGASLGVIFLAVDLFQRVTDEFGHDVGDQVLRMVGQSLANGLRRGDLPVRWGGEKFLALLPGIDSRGLRATAERVRMLVANSWLEHESSQIGVTVSIGATMVGSRETVGEVLDRAEHLMYLAQTGGRDRVRCNASEPTRPAPSRLSGSPFAGSGADGAPGGQVGHLQHG